MVEILSERLASPFAELARHSDDPDDFSRGLPPADDVREHLPPAAENDRKAVGEMDFQTAHQTVEEKAHRSEDLIEQRAVTNPQQAQTDVLHVGCGEFAREKLPPVFRDSTWREIRLDIDPEVAPDFVASITDMRVISDGAVDAVYSSHNLEHLYPHDVPLALREMRRVLKQAGYALIKLPDIQEVARHVAEGRLEQPLYISPMGAISALDMMYGHRPSLARGNLFMAHRTGFTSETLGTAMIEAGFAAVLVQRTEHAFLLTAIGFRSKPDREALATAQARMLSDPDRPSVLYSRTI